MAPIERRRWQYGILIATICLVLPYTLYYGGILFAIYRQDLTYNDQFGWIDWDHAQTEGTALLLRDLEKSLQSPSAGGDTITYRQRLRMAAVRGSVEKRFVVKNLSETNKVPVAYAIFTSVSQSFEAMQGEFPFNLIPFVNLAAFDREDENGNNISFYCACKGIRTGDFKARVSNWPAGAAAWLFVRQRFGFAHEKASSTGAAEWYGYEDFWRAMPYMEDGAVKCIQTLKKVTVFEKTCIFVQNITTMVIQRTDSQIIITLPASIDIEGVQRLINYLLYKEATKDSKAKQEEVDKLAREVNKQWWEENKHRFLPS